MVPLNMSGFYRIRFSEDSLLLNKFSNSYSSFFFKISDTVEVPIPNFSASCYWFNFGTDSAARIKSILVFNESSIRLRFDWGL